MASARMADEARIAFTAAALGLAAPARATVETLLCVEV